MPTARCKVHDVDGTMKILLVDDSRAMRRMERRILSSAWPRMMIVEGRDGREALALIADHENAGEPFDLVLVDRDMPDMDGLALVGRLRESGRLTPLIVVTTDGRQAEAIEAIMAGANHYLVKPFTPDELLARVLQTHQRCSAPHRTAA